VLTVDISALEVMTCVEAELIVEFVKRNTTERTKISIVDPTRAATGDVTSTVEDAVSDRNEPAESNTNDDFGAERAWQMMLSFAQETQR
jgi:hypothetical protein